MRQQVTSKGGTTAAAINVFQQHQLEQTITKRASGGGTCGRDGEIILIKLKSNYWLILNYLGYFCAYGVFVPLIPVWLQSQSYSDENIALLLASAYIFRFLGGIFFRQIKIPLIYRQCYAIWRLPRF